MVLQYELTCLFLEFKGKHLFFEKSYRHCKISFLIISGLGFLNIIVEILLYISSIEVEKSIVLFEALFKKVII
jgi:hypothetical protein